MRGTLKTVGFMVVLVLTILFVASGALAVPTSPEQAKAVVAGWLAVNDAPLGAKMSSQVGDVKTYSGKNGGALFYYVALTPSGGVIVAADDLLEPIVAFLPQGHYDGSPKNPLTSMLFGDLPARLADAKNQSGKGNGHDVTYNQVKWAAFSGAAAKSGIASVSDPRVDPLVQSKWSQSEAYAGGPLCYNYYTPNNYVCGCVATAMSQLMRFYQQPTFGIGAGTYNIWVDNVVQNATTRGGDGAGGPYVWADMVLDPGAAGASLTTAQCQAIGALCYDAGVTANMSYAAAGSSTGTGNAVDKLKNVFGYSNAIYGYSGAIGTNIPTATLLKMVNPNLDGGRPVLLGITEHATAPHGGGHEIVCDGYGYQAGTLYHHLNMGWAGTDDAWYNLPNIDCSGPYEVIDDLGYNIYVSGTGEMVSGRVLDMSGNPVSGATVTATGGGNTYTATSNARGIYALQLPSGTTFSVSVTGTTSAGRLAYPTKNLTTGTSASDGMVVGNLWGEDFQNNAPVTPTVTPTITVTPTTTIAPTTTVIPTGGGGGGGGGGCNAAFAPALVLLALPLIFIRK